MVLHAVSARFVRLLAAVCVTALSVLTVGAASARAAESSLTVRYACAFPLIGPHTVSVTYREDLPGSAMQGVLASPVGATADIAVPAIATAALSLVGAATISGSIAGDESVTDGAARFGGPVRYAVPGTPVPASGAFTMEATGTFPSVLFPDAGTADLTVGNLSLTLTPLSGKGRPTALGTFTARCTPRPGQDNVLGSFPVLAKATSSAALAVSPSPSVAGVPVTLTATVSAKAPATRVPTGKVTFSDQRFGGSTSNAVTQVVKTATTTTVASSANPSVQGQAVTYTATVGSSDGGGRVAFDDGGKPVTGCTAQSLNGSGQATCQVTYVTTGSHAITAVYSGDPAAPGSTSDVLRQSVVVDRADLSVQLSMPTQAGDGAIVTQKVTVTNLGPATANTEVTALDEPTVLAVVDAGGALVRGPLLTWSRPSLAPGASETFTVTVQAGSRVSGTVQVDVGTLSSTPDPDMVNNLAIAQIRLG